MSGAIAATRVMAAQAPSLPGTAVLDFLSNDTPNGVYWRNQQSAAPSTPVNLLEGVSTGSLITFGTVNYATGPGGSATATRVQLAAGSNLSVFEYVTLPAGSYTLQIKAKSNTGGGSQSFQLGAYGYTQTSATVTEAGWSSIQATIPGGVALGYVWINNNTGSPIDILVDEVQLVAGSSVPTFSSPSTGSAFQPKPSGIITTGGAVDFATAKQLSSPRWPLGTAVNDFTVMAAILTTDTTLTATKIASYEFGDSGSAVGTNSGGAYGAPAIGSGGTGNRLNVSDGHWHVLASRRSSSEAAFFLDGVKVKSGSGSSTPIAAKQLYIGSDGTYTYKGDISQITVWDRSLTDNEIATAMAVYSSRQSTLGLSAITPRKNLWVAEGDSITAASSSYPGVYFTTPSSGFWGIDVATSGSTLSDCNARLPGVLAIIANCLAVGIRPIVSLLIGTNGLPPIADLQTYWGACRSAGAKVIACTTLPRADATYNTNRAPLNVQIRAASSSYDALCDVAADPYVGTDAAPYSTTYYLDGMHPNSAGQSVLATLMASALASVATS